VDKHFGQEKTDERKGSQQRIQVNRGTTVSQRRKSSVNKEEQMRIVALIFGIVLILLVALDAFETIVLPRRVTRRLRLAQLFYRAIRVGWKSLGHLVRTGARRDAFLGYMGPLSLLALLAFWAVLFVFGFGLLWWGLALPLGASDKVISFLTYLYLSGTTFFTLGLGDVTPMPGVGRVLVVAEVALGFIFLALVISYVPIIYQAFSRRELRISLLDARAGSPATAAELLRRNHDGRSVEELRLLLHDWEVWCADILESHLSYPILAFYRSQHQQQSWVEALTVILDTCALILTGIEGTPVEPARFAFAMARHAVVDLAQVLDTSPTPGVNRLSSVAFTQLQDMLAASGIRLKEGPATEQKLAELRATYEPFVSALANHIQVSLPPWIPPGDTLDDWQTSAWDDMFPYIPQTLNKVMHPE
jgi:Ion channel